MDPCPDPYPAFQVISNTDTGYDVALFCKINISSQNISFYGTKKIHNFKRRTVLLDDQMYNFLLKMISPLSARHLSSLRILIDQDFLQFSALILLLPIEMFRNKIAE